MSQVAATLSTRLKKAEHQNIDHVMPGAEYIITGEGWPHSDMPVPQTERKRAGEGEEDIIEIRSIFTE